MDEIKPEIKIQDTTNSLPTIPVPHLQPTPKHFGNKAVFIILIVIIGAGSWFYFSVFKHQQNVKNPVLAEPLKEVVLEQKITPILNERQESDGVVTLKWFY